MLGDIYLDEAEVGVKYHVIFNGEPMAYPHLGEEEPIEVGKHPDDRKLVVLEGPLSGMNFWFAEPERAVEVYLRPVGEIRAYPLRTDEIRKIDFQPEPVEE